MNDSVLRFSKMREPPRIEGSFYSDNFGSSATPMLAPFPSPPRRSNKRVFIAFGITFVAMSLVCGGSLAWLYTSFNSGNTIAAEYLEQREQANEPLPISIVEQLKHAKPQSVETNEDIRSVVEFLRAAGQVSDVDTDEESIDYPRVVTEMQRTGMATGVNQFTKFIWIENIKGAFELPDLGTNFEVIGFEWLLPNVEARVSLVAYYDWDDKPMVYLCYLTRESGDWKYYDSRNILEPMSEAQYLAAYAAAPLSTSENFYELGNALYELNYSDLDDEEKANRSLREYQSRRYPSTMRPSAQSLTADYMVDYGNAESLRKLTEKIADSSFAGAQWVKGKLALLEQDKAAAFERASKLMEQVGWHPVGALLAAEAAEAPSEMTQAAQWLAQSVLLMPEHDYTARQFFSVANETQIQELMATIVQTPDAPMRYLQLTQNAGVEKYDTLQRIAESSDHLETATKYVNLLRMDASVEPQKTLDAAVELLSLPDVDRLFPDSDFQAEQELTVDNFTFIWSKLLSAATHPGMLDRALTVVPDREEFSRRLRDRLLSNRYATADWNEVLRVFEDLPDDSELALEPETRAAMGVAQSRLKRYEDAFPNLFAFVSTHREEILDAEPPDYAYTLLPALSESAAEANRIEELLTMLDQPETAFVIIAATLSERTAYRVQLQNALAWYAAYPDTPQQWRHYYQADLAYASGNWEAADREIAQAIEFAEDDERIENFELPGLLYDFVPFSEDVSEWHELRVEMAIRCGKLSQLIADLENEDDFQDNYLSALNYELDVASYGLDPDSEPTVEQVIELMAASDNDYLRCGAAAKKSELQRYKGDLISAISSALAGCKRVEEPVYYGSSCFNSAALLIALTEQWKFIDELKGKASDQAEEATVAALVALRDGDPVAFSEAMLSYDESYRASFWMDDFEIIEQLKKRGMWSPYNTQFSADTVSLSYYCSSTGILLLDSDPSKSLDEIESAVRSIAGEEIERIAKTRFPNALDGWYADTEAGRIVAVVYESLKAEDDLPQVERLKDSSQGILAIALISPKGILAAKRMRQLAVEMGQELSSAKGYIDYQSDSWFLDAEGSSWRDQLNASAEHGVNRRSPKSDYFPWHAINQATNDSRECIRVQVGVILEEIPVEPLGTGETQGDSANPAAMLKDSPILLPILSAGDRVE
jgi:hypothetical protein